ncbi:MAG: vanadium-dependent haloperoxidase [Rubrivivax sp.]|nr:vanadium-dependent haloperoxidase [Rubrivivax sp.]
MDTLSVKWAHAALEAIRHIGATGVGAERNRIGPPMVARSLALLHTAIYDAWALHDLQALPLRLSAARVTGATQTQMEKSLHHAAHAVLADQFPTETAIFDALLAANGSAPSTSIDPATPEGIGNLAARAVLACAHGDGANQAGLYVDTTGYLPVNMPMQVTAPARPSDILAPDRWQPLAYTDGGGVLRVPGYIGPQWEHVRPFALKSAGQFRPSAPAPITSQAFLDQARHVVAVQDGLNVKQKVTAEYWADGPASELPPGHWELFAAHVSARDHHTLAQDVKMFFAVANAIHDAAIAVWECKRHYDYVRPVTAIRHLFRGKRIRGWTGTTEATIDGEAWRPYQVSTFPTPPFPEFVSGHSGFSAAAAEVLRRFTGSDAFGASYVQPGPLRVEPSLASAAGTTLSWSTFSAAADEAGESRLYGGIHFYEGNAAGLALGRKVGAAAFEKAQAHWSGRP